MWSFLQSIQEQVAKYSTWIGQLWYLCVFVFRLFVVVTIGGAVYGDELSEFQCSTKEPGCEKMCFNVFSRMSHLRFWCFQLLAVTTPTVLFHFYSMSVIAQIHKSEDEEKRLREENHVNDMQSMLSSQLPSNEDNEKTMKTMKKLERRKKKIGEIKKKKVFSSGKGELTEVVFTMTIHVAYYISILIRLVVEGVFIYLGYTLFKFMDQSQGEAEADDALDFLRFSVPAMFKCDPKLDAAVEKACSQVATVDGSVPCWVSRPYEKTVLIRYMNCLSAVCFVLSAVELIYIPVRMFLKERKERQVIVRRQRNGNACVQNQYATHMFSPAPSYQAGKRFSGNLPSNFVYANSVISESVEPPRFTVPHDGMIPGVNNPHAASLYPPTMNNIAMHNLHMHNQAYVRANGDREQTTPHPNIAPSEFRSVNDGMA